MKRKTLRSQLAKAQKRCDEMKQARSFGEVEEKWTDYLHELERIWNWALSLHKEKPDWGGVSGQFNRDRSKDPLLKYLRNARGVGEHTVQEVTRISPGSVKIGTVPGRKDGVFVESLILVEGRISSMSIKGPHRIEISDPAVIPLPVRNRGVDFPVPTEHLGKRIPSDIAVFAQLGIDYYSSFVDALEARYNL